jgi:cephalosporin-C deacetylase
MPLIDMPLDELRQYKGISPCPDDIDAFWDEAVEEMKNVHAKLVLSRAPFQCGFADCFEMYFDGVGGARIYAKYVKPKKQVMKQPALVKFHGYSMSSGDWVDLLPYAAEGFHIAAMDCRGQAGKSQDTGVVNGNTLEGHIIRGLEDGPPHLLYRSISECIRGHSPHGRKKPAYARLHGSLNAGQTVICQDDYGKPEEAVRMADKVP